MLHFCEVCCPALRRCLQGIHYLSGLEDVSKEQREFCDEVYLTSRCFAYLLNVKPGWICKGFLVLKASLHRGARGFPSMVKRGCLKKKKNHHPTLERISILIPGFERRLPYWLQQMARPCPTRRARRLGPRCAAPAVPLFLCD